MGVQSELLIARATSQRGTHGTKVVRPNLKALELPDGAVSVELLRGFNLPCGFCANFSSLLQTSTRACLSRAIIPELLSIFRGAPLVRRTTGTISAWDCLRSRNRDVRVTRA